MTSNQEHWVSHDLVNARNIYSTQELQGGRRNCLFYKELHHIRFIGELEDGVGGLDGGHPHILASQVEYEG
jgi:hypothetical protein